MTEKEFDKVFRDGLQQHSSPVPEDMWQKITAEQQRRKRAWFFWWISLPGLVLVSAITIAYLLSKQGDATSSAKRGSDTNTVAGVTGNAIQQQNNGMHSVDSINRVNNADGGGMNDTVVLSSVTNSGRFLKNGVMAAGSPVLHPRKTNKKLSNAKERISQDKVGVTKTGSIPVEPFVNTADTVRLALYYDAGDSLIKGYNKVAQDNVSKDPQRDTSMLPANEATEAEPVPMWLDVFITPELPFTNISSIDPAYPGFRKSAAHLGFAYGVEARLSIPFSKRITGKIGLRYGQINERFTDNTLNTTYGNHYKSIELPLLLGYQFTYKDLILSANAGVSVNISSGYSGTVISPSYQPADIGGSAVYKRNTGVSLVAGFAVYRPINDRWLLYAEPNLRYKLTNMTGSFQAFEQRMHSAGLSLGVRYNFSQPAQ